MSNINMGPSDAFNLIKETTGNFEDIGATQIDAKNFKRDLNQYKEKRDADFVLENLERKRECLTDFFFDYAVGPENELTGLFWADSEARRNYNAFGDVVGFDATYRTNK